MDIHKREEDRSKWDSVWVGLLLALAVPAVVMILYWYALLSKDMGLGSMLTGLGAAALMKIFAICASPDLLLFGWLSRKNWSYAAKGVVYAMVVLLLITLVIKM